MERIMIKFITKESINVIQPLLSSHKITTNSQYTLSVPNKYPLINASREPKQRRPKITPQLYQKPGLKTHLP